MRFDVAGALKAGATPDQIAQFLAEKRGFDLDSALQAGASVDQVIQFLNKPQQEPGLIDRAKQGFRSTVSAGQIAATDDPAKIAELVSEEQRTRLPATAAQRQMAEEIKPLQQAYEKATGLEAVGAFASLAAKRLSQFATNPRELVGSIAENLPNSAPGMAGTLAGAAGGAATPVPGGAIIGGVAGGTAGGYFIEQGAAMRDQILKAAQERGIDPRDAKALEPLIREQYQAFLENSRLKGIGTAGTDAVLNMLTLGVAGLGERTLAKEARALTEGVKSGTVNAADAATQLAAIEARQAARSTMPARLARGTGVTAAEVVGEGASEAVGQKLAYGQVDALDVIDESILGLGQGAAMAGGRGVYNRVTGAPTTSTVDQSIAAAQAEISRQRAGMPPPAAAPVAPDLQQQFEQAVTNLEQAVDPYLGVSQARTTDEAIQAAGASTAVDLTPPDVVGLAQRRAQIDREADLLAQAEKAGTEFERRMAKEQAAATRGEPKRGAAADFVDLTPMSAPQASQRLAVLRDTVANAGGDALTLTVVPHPSQAGAFAIGRQQLPSLDLGTTAPAISMPQAQQRLETAALTGQVAQAQQQDQQSRQVVIDRALRNVEERGGVASPAEARIFQEAGLGTPYDRVDTNLAPALSTDEQLTQATGIALAPTPRSTGSESQRLAAVEQTNAESMSEQERRAAANRAQAERQTLQQIEATSRPAALPDAGSVISALAAPGPQRTAEQVSLINQAQSRFEPADFSILQRAAVAPFRLSQEERMRLRDLRSGAAQPAVAAAPVEAPAAPALVGSRVAERLGMPSNGRVVTSNAKLSTQRVAPGATVAVNDGDTQHQARVVEVSRLGNTGRLLQQVARIFGKRLVVFESDTLQADGFVLDNDNRSVYINAKSQLNPLAVFGHELTHLLKRDNPKAYAALEAVVQRELRDGAMEQFQQEYGEGASLEEMASDLVGNRFKEPDFWQSVFDEIAAQNPEGARGIIMRLAAALNRAVNSFLQVVRQPGFRADQYVNDLNAVKQAVREAVQAYAQQQREPAMALEAETVGESSATAYDSGANEGARNARFSDARRGAAVSEAAEEDGRGAGEDGGDQVPSYGQAREGAVSVVGRHYSPEPRQSLNGGYYGRGLKGAERDRLDGSPDPRLRSRVYFYVDQGAGIRPEAGVGGYAHEVRLNNIYDPQTRLVAPQANANAFESAVINAGFDGYIAPFGNNQAAVVLLGPKHSAVPVRQLGQVASAPAPAAAAPATLRKGLMSRELEAIDTANIPGARVRAGNLEIPADQTQAANDELARIGSNARFSAARRGGVAEEVGDFIVRTQKDGTLGVAGDVEAIRALLPEGIKGRAVPGGLVFTTSDAPRVKAALEGRKIAYSRAGQVIDKLPMKDGKYVGAPEKYNTPGKISTLRKNLRKLTLEGERGRYWYENSSREVLQMVGGNVQEARKFVALLSIYSPQAKVDANSTFALRAWAQYKAGQPIQVKTGVQDAKAQAALDDVDAFWSGEKTGNFFTNLLREIDPTLAQGATIDMWMMRAGEYSSDAPTATQYAFMENETNRLAQELGWEPQQVQAAIWVAMKARMENPGVKKRTEASSEKKGWIRYDYPLKNGRPVKTRVILNAQAHRDNWLKHAFDHTPTKDDTEQAKFDFSDGLRRHIGQLSWEARPGRSTNVLPGVNDAPYEQQVEFQRAVQKALLDNDGVDLLAYKLGLLVDGPDILAPGIWQGEIAAGMQKQVAMAPAKGDEGKTNIDPAQKKAIETYASMLGLLLRQEGVGYHRPFYKGTKAAENGVSLEIGRTFTPDEAQALWGAIDQRMREAGVEAWENGAGMISAPTGMRVVNFGALPDNTKFRALVKSAAETLAVDEVTLQSFSTDGDLVFNDWKESPNGEGYRSRISEAYGPDLLDWARDVLAPRVQSVFNEFSSRYGWGDPGRVDTLFERAAEAGTAQEVTPSEPAAEQAPASDAASADITMSRRRNYGSLTPDQEQALRNVGGIKPDQTVGQRMQELSTRFANTWVGGIFDQFAELRELDPKAYILARLSKGTEGTLEALMLYGKPFLTKDGVADVNVSDEGFAKVLARLEGEQDRFLWWVAAQRAERLKAQGLENLFTDQDISSLKQLNQGNLPSGKARGQAYAQALQEMNEFNDAVLKVAEESGLIDPEARKLFKDTPYVPFYRVMEQEDGVAGPTFSSGLTNQYAWKKLKGGKQKLNEDLLSNVLLNWSHLYAAAAKNRAASAALQAGVQAGVAQVVPSGTKGSVRVRDNGKEVHYLVTDPGVMAAIGAIEYKTPGFFKPFSTMKRWLSIGVTANPAYKVKNLMRDSIASVAVSELSGNVAGNVARGLKATSKESQTFASMLAGGGLIRFGSMLDGDNADRTRKLIAKEGGQLLDEKGWKKLSGMLVATWDAYNELGDRFENANRAALYEQLRAKGYSELDANFMSRDLMDFSMSGRWPVVRFLVETVPFMNARLQGLYKLGKGAKENPRKFGYVVGAVALASLALMLAYEDDEDWKKRPDWDRDANWWFKIGDTAFRIPKPFEVGAIGTIAERGWELAFNKEMDMRRFGQRLSDMIFNTFAMDPTPQIVKPLFDIYANKAQFTNRPIESMGMEKLRPEDRYDERTSYVARFLGQLGLPNPAGLVRGEYDKLSPVQIDYLLRGYFAWLGTAATTVMDYGIRPMLDGGERPDMRLRDVFFVGNFAETLPSSSSRYLDQLYEQSKLIEEAYSSYRAAVKKGDVEAARSLLAEEGDKIRTYRQVNRVKDRVGEINAKIKQVEASKSMSGETKRRLIDMLNNQKNQLAERAAPALAR